jgi:hypothetical protein
LEIGESLEVLFSSKQNLSFMPDVREVLSGPVPISPWILSILRDLREVSSGPIPILSWIFSRLREVS